ncbi:glutamate--tRNA ligase family protein, partial [Prescottella defluvii]|uniref:glutamate--tRNA ligase family protein n=1 Tax=Prescottella defluvii TaxID=1323361 RepID=UPI0004F32111
CRHLSEAERDERRATGRSPALRLRAGSDSYTVDDVLHGPYAAEGIDQVVRGDDLLSSAPRQAYLAGLLGLPTPEYAHVPLALNTEGKRLAKRDGAVTLADQAALGRTPRDVLGMLARSLGMAGDDETVTLPTLLDRWDPKSLPLDPWIYGM